MELFKIQQKNSSKITTTSNSHSYNFNSFGRQNSFGFSYKKLEDLLPKVSQIKPKSEIQDQEINLYKVITLLQKRL